MGCELGVLRVRDVRGVDGARPGASVGVLVIGADGEMPFVGPVTLTTKRSGRGDHLALLCSMCMRARAVLYVHERRLACSGCAGRRTRRQRERTLASWRRGGREEDRLLRLTGQGCSIPSLRALVDEIVEGDEDRAAVIADAFHDIVVVMEQRDAES